MNQDEITQTTNLLSKLEPGYLPEPIFHEFTRLSVSGILELIPLRKNESEQVEVLVLNRADDDPHWPGMLHTPGTLLRPTDSDDFSTALERVFSEFGRKYKDYQVKKIDTIFHNVKRGKELSVIFITEVIDKRELDIWINLNEIEDQIVDTQVDFIRKAAELFNK